MNALDQDIAIHAIEKNSLTNGPGNRMVIWVQGCTLNCPGCFNPETHNPLSGNLLSVHSILQQIKDQQKNLEGITISGGEPLQQLPVINTLCQEIKKQTNLGIILLTGFTYTEAQNLFLFNSLISTIDLLIAGRFILKQKNKIRSEGFSQQNLSLYYGSL